MNLNVILRGQSNALLFGEAERGATLAKLAQDVRQLLGFNGTTDTVTVHFSWAAAGPNTVYSGSAFLTEWISAKGGDWTAGWNVLPREQGILDYARSLPASVRDDPTAVLWFHSEYDSARDDLTAAEWVSGVRFDAGLLRATLGQSAATTPYLFVSAHPYWGTDQGHQAIRVGMETLAADAGFNADIAARLLDVNADLDDWDGNAGTREYGGGHLSDADQRIAEGRIARSLAETWAAYAKPGSPVAVAGGNIDDHGPRVAEATVVGTNQLSLRFAFDAASRLQALDADAARGVGWSVRTDQDEVSATAAALSGTDGLLLTFGGAIPAGGKLFYGYGYGRLADGKSAGQGNAVYDDQGMPAWVAASGLSVTGGATFVPPTYNPASLTVGTGPDRLVLSLSQDAYRGSAQYTVSVDGVQVSGTLTASALRSSGQRDTVTVQGDWAGGPHSATVTFLNDAWGGSAATDRNLYLEAATYNGAAAAGARASLLAEGSASFGFTDTAPVAPNPNFPPASLTIGSGTDRLVLSLSQDAYQGSAQYTVKVDGVQVGGTLTASALRAGGQHDTVTVQGNWAGGAHTATVTFLNDAWGGSAATDRNLYVDGATYNGTAIAGVNASLLAAGAANLGFTDTGPVAPPIVPTPPPPSSGGQPANLTVGTGADKLVLRVSQDAYQGSAQYTVSVDGVQVGGTLTAAALRGSGQSDTVTVQGEWSAGNHTVSINFLNDAWGGSAATDRNLYVEGATYNGAAVSGAARTLLSDGPASFGFTEAGTPPPPGSANATIGSGPDALVLRISQDAYQGSAQYTVRVDGVQVGGTQTAQALHGGALSDALTVKGNWSQGNHTVSINFLNDAWGGSAATDRNLYLDGATYNGTAVTGATAVFEREGAQGFSFLDPLV